MKKLALALSITLVTSCSGLMPALQGRGAALVLTPRIDNGTFQTQTTVNVYTSASIDHLTIKLFQGSTEIASKTIPQAQLTNTIAFSNLRNSTSYRIKSYAYKADNSLISHDDASSWLDITTTTDDRPSISALPVHLIDIDFNGQGTSSIQVTSGSYQLAGPEKMGFLLSGIPSTVAGNGSATYSGDGGAATSAGIKWPYGLAFDSQGNFYITDQQNHRIRKVDKATGIISTVAGNGSATCAGDGGQATSASISTPYGIAVDASNNLYIADTGNSRIRKVEQSTGIISTVAGNGATCYAGDGGQATSASLWRPYRIAFDSSGNLFIADTGNSSIRRVDKATGIISTLAGNGTSGFAGDGGPASAAKLSAPNALAFDELDNLYIADTVNQRIRRIDKTTGIIQTVAGNGVAAFAGDGGQATAASIMTPRDLTVDIQGSLFIADTDNHRVRKVDASGVIRTIVGGGTATYTEGAQATSIDFSYITGLKFDSVGNLYICDYSPNYVRKIR